jgi:hypothetical protein
MPDNEGSKPEHIEVDPYSKYADLIVPFAAYDEALQFLGEITKGDDYSVEVTKLWSRFVKPKTFREHVEASAHGGNSAFANPEEAVGAADPAMVKEYDAIVTEFNSALDQMAVGDIASLSRAFNGAMARLKALFPQFKSLEKY